MNGYKKLMSLDIEVPAEMAESIGGFESKERVERELVFALSAVTLDDRASLQWLAALIEAWL